jgi:hypothetical protein
MPSVSKRIKMNRSDWIVIIRGVTLVIVILFLWWLIFPANFSLFFTWPTGFIWGNIVAELFLGFSALVAVLRKMDKHHREKMAQAEHHHSVLLHHLGHPKDES